MTICAICLTKIYGLFYLIIQVQKNLFLEGRGNKNLLTLNISMSCSDGTST